MMDDSKSTNDALEKLACDAEMSLPLLFAELRRLCCQADPIQLLSALTLRHQIHIRTAIVDPDEFARWQVRIEFAAWLVGSDVEIAAIRPATHVEPSDVDHFEVVLTEYCDAASWAILRRDPNLDAERNSLRALVRTEAVHVRG